MPTFTPLRLHSGMSFSCGLDDPAHWADRAAAAGYTACALTDRAASFGIPAFVAACRRADLRPILGNEVPTTDGSALVLLAETATGFANIMELAGSFRSGNGVDHEALAAHADGVLCLAGCGNGPVGRALAAGEDGTTAIAPLLEIFGPKRLALELFPETPRPLAAALTKIADHAGILLAASTDTRCIAATDEDLVNLLTADAGMPPPEGPAHLMGAQDAARAFADAPAALAANSRLAGRLDADFYRTGEMRLPVWDGGDADVELDARCRAALTRYPEPRRTEAAGRLSRELAVIRSRGLAPYFLVVAELIAWAHKTGIPVGPGRGSAVGSLVVYSLGITRVDPLAHGLVFERFLNPERPDLPDIDLDIGWREREKLFAWLRRRHGPERVAHVATLDCRAPRSAVRDAARLLGFAPRWADRLAARLPAWPREGLARAVAEDERLAAAWAGHDDVRRVLTLALRLEGRPRHASVHAGAAIVSPLPLSSFAAMETTSSGQLIVQLTGEDAARLGLVKIDILGLRFLSVNADALAATPAVDPEQIDRRDPAVYELLSSGNTTGIFQLESAGMRSLLRRVRPRRFPELAAVLALYRPGPIRGGLIEAFTRRLHGEEPTPPRHPLLAPILAETHGVFLYQEQVLAAAAACGGLTPGEGDSLRRALAKRDPDTVAGLRDRFIAGSALPADEAAALFDELAHFAGYGFNKSHAVAYAATAWLNAWWRVHHPSQFFLALLNNNLGFPGRLNRYLDEARRSGITIRGPDVNRSGLLFSMENGTVRCGLAVVANLGPRTALRLIRHRHTAGLFCSFSALAAAAVACGLDRAAFECLVRSGACDHLYTDQSGPLSDRITLLALAPRVLARARAGAHSRPPGQGELFPGLDDQYECLPEERPPPPEEEVLRELEYRASGLWLGGSPLAAARSRLAREGVIPLATALETNRAPDRQYRLAGFFHGRRFSRSRTGGGRGFVTGLFADESGETAAVFHPDARRHLPPDGERPLLVEAKILVRHGEPNLRLEWVAPLPRGWEKTPFPERSGDSGLSVRRK